MLNPLLESKKMKIRLFETPEGRITHIDPDADDREIDPAIDMLPGSGYAEDLGEWEFEVAPNRGSVTVGVTEYEEPLIFVGDMGYYPQRYGRDIVLKPGMEPRRKDDWIFGKKVR